MLPKSNDRHDRVEHLAASLLQTYHNQLLQIQHSLVLFRFQSHRAALLLECNSNWAYATTEGCRDRLHHGVAQTRAVKPRYPRVDFACPAASRRCKTTDCLLLRVSHNILMLRSLLATRMCSSVQQSLTCRSRPCCSTHSIIACRLTTEAVKSNPRPLPRCSYAWFGWKCVCRRS